MYFLIFYYFLDKIYVYDNSNCEDLIEFCIFNIFISFFSTY